MSAVKRQMEVFEEKVVGIEERCGFLQTASLARFEERLTMMEGQQHKLGRNMIEISGTVKGLSDVMQVEIKKTDFREVFEERIGRVEGELQRFARDLSEVTRTMRDLPEGMKDYGKRMDIVETRFSDWRRSLEDDLRKSHHEFEQNMQKLSSSVRNIGVGEDDDRRKHAEHVHRLETELGRYSRVYEEIQKNHTNVSSRLSVLEDRQAREAARSTSNSLTADLRNSVPLEPLKLQLDDLSMKLGRVSQDVLNVQTQFETQEAELDTIRSSQSRMLGGTSAIMVEGGSSQLTSLVPKVNELVSRLQELSPKIIAHEGRLNNLDDNERGIWSQLDHLRQGREKDDRWLEQLCDSWKAERQTVSNILGDLELLKREVTQHRFSR